MMRFAFPLSVKHPRYVAPGADGIGGVGVGGVGVGGEGIGGVRVGGVGVGPPPAAVQIRRVMYRSVRSARQQR